MRGALNAVGVLTAAQRGRGVITHSSGNHGRALAWAARSHGIPVVVVMPDVARDQGRGTRALGAEIVMVRSSDRETRTAGLAADRGLVVIPPFDHPDIIAGQGTVGLEIVEDLPAVDTVLAPVGGEGSSQGGRCGQGDQPTHSRRGSGARARG